MFSKASFSILVVFATLALNVAGHAIVEPPLGVKGTASRNNVLEPSNGSPCGPINIASAIGQSTAVKATNGAFTVTVQNFDACVFQATAYYTERVIEIDLQRP